MSDHGTQVRSASSYEVTIEGTPYTQPEGQGVQALVVEDHVDMVSMLSLEVGGAEGQPSWPFKIGQEVTAKVGDQTVLLFKGHITALEPAWDSGQGARIVVRALDPIHKLGRGRKTRVFEDMKDSDIASTVGSECGLSVSADSTTQTHKYVLQRNESNVAFLKRLAARNNFLLRVDQGTLVFKKNEYKGEEVTVTYGTNVRSARFAFNTADLADQVIVRGWDIQQKAEIVGTAQSVVAVGGGDIGIDLAKKHFGSTIAYITDVPVADQAHAGDIAKAELDRIARQFVRGTATIQGDDRVRAGAVVVFSGFSSPWDGKYFVMASRHVITTRGGYVTEFTFCSNSLGS